MSSGPTIFFAGGGTGGHLYPGISVAAALLRIRPDVRPIFLCTNRPIDRTILQPTGFAMVPQPIVPPQKTIVGLLKFWKSWRDTKELVRQLSRKEQPKAVLGLGGYAAGVAVKYCSQHGVPGAILNPDVIPGKANNYLMGYVSKVCCQFDETRQHVRADRLPKLITTGCPIRSDIVNLPPRADAMARLGLNPAHLTLVITGASQGAESVNEAMLEVVPSLNLQGWQILHLTGSAHAQKVTTGYRQNNVPANVVAFTPNMADVWAVADLVVSRAGGSTCAEVTACGIPAIFLPYPFHKDKHQRANAKVIADAGGGIVLDDQKNAQKNAAQLKPELDLLLYDANRRAAMAAACKALGKPDASDQVAQALAAMIK